MWNLTTWSFGEEQEVFVSEGIHFFTAGEDVYEVTPQQCHWRWWSIDFGYVGNSQPYEINEPTPDFDPTT